MEKNIFKFGESSAAIILPKKWMEKHGLSPKSPLHLTEDQVGNLILAASEYSKKEECEFVVNPNTKSDLITKSIGLNYMYGTGKIRLYSKEGFTKPQLDKVYEKIGTDCPGFEITSQSTNEVIIEDFTNIKEVDIGKLINRIKSMVNEEFNETSKGNFKTIPEIERLVNRFFMLGMRYVNITQAKDDMKYFVTLQALESISDKMDMISKLPSIKDTKIFEDLQRQFDLCFKGFGGDQQAIEQVESIYRSVLNKMNQPKVDKIYSYLIIDIANSISRIADFGFRSNNEKLSLH